MSRRARKGFVENVKRKYGKIRSIKNEFPTDFIYIFHASYEKVLTQTIQIQFRYVWYQIKNSSYLLIKQLIFKLCIDVGKRSQQENSNQ